MKARFKRDQKRVISAMFLRSILFNMLTMIIGAGFLYFGYQAYLISDWAIAMLGIVGGAVIVLFSIMLIIMKILFT